ncbi:MAG TPA: single-stranded DNA-binding protein [Bdellovibrionota bacterium]|jgi:single-strand DNA-binding protein|nr:single-stranded DNA-binding protein [Bdellovibrionota bacterium]
MSVNKVILVGRLGQNPEVRYTPSGAAVANFSVATNENWTDKQGQKQERTEWHRVVVWGKLAELCNQYLSKGRQVYLEGRLQTREWEDKTGVKKYTTEVHAQTVQFLGGQAGASAGEGRPSQGREFGGGAAAEDQSFGQAPRGAANAGPADEPSFTEDDIPF